MDRIFDREIELIKLLRKNDEFITSKEICHNLGISPRTLRSDLKNNRDYFLLNGFDVVSRYGAGYTLEVIDEKKYYDYIQANMRREESSQSLIPVYPEDRINYLIRFFLTNENYIKIEDLASALFTSKSTISNDLKEVRKRLSFFKLSIETRPSYGLILIGNEINKRSCIAQYFFHTDTVDLKFLKQTMENNTQEKIKMILYKTLQRNHFKLTDVGFQNLIIHLSIALIRINETSSNKIETYEDLVDLKEYQIATEVIEGIEDEFKTKMEKIEISYVTIHLLGKKISRGTSSSRLTAEVKELMDETFSVVKNTYGIDFSSDFELYTLLAIHMGPLLNRLKYGLRTQNPLLEKIRTDMNFAFELSIIVANIIQKEFGFDVSEDEIGFIALHFELALERYKKGEIKKKNVIIICASGQGSSQILLHQIKQQFSDNIDKIIATEMYNLPNVDQKDFELILSTIPITTEAKIPVIQVDNFLSNVDFKHVSAALTKTEDASFVDDFFSEDLFFTELQGKDKNSVLSEMVENINNVFRLPANFLESLLERESYASTEFGQLIAFPHPIKPITDNTFIAVGVLNKGLKWENEVIKYIFLISIKKDSEENLSAFYEAVSLLIGNRKLMQQFDEEPTIENLKRVLSVINEENDSDKNEELFF